MTPFTKNSFVAIRNDINAALAAVGAKHDMQLSIDRITYTESTFRTTLSAVKNGAITNDTPAESSQEIKWKAAFIRNPSQFGMTAEDFGREVAINGQKYVIAGARPKAQASIVLKKPSGAYVAHTAYTVQQALKRKVS